MLCHFCCCRCCARLLCLSAHRQEANAPLWNIHWVCRGACSCRLLTSSSMLLPSRTAASMSNAVPPPCSSWGPGPGPSCSGRRSLPSWQASRAVLPAWCCGVQWSSWPHLALSSWLYQESAPCPRQTPSSAMRRTCWSGIEVGVRAMGDGRLLVCLQAPASPAALSAEAYVEHVVCSVCLACLLRQALSDMCLVCWRLRMSLLLLPPQSA